ncbi:hypothetical protein L2E82_21405 [Cichorium intybus]|uniref:Uncharacterized protein n=1 Tax=Cichorium intybus TaxID=13427 RepID=A0ACB9DWQ8_CICIN|nr:hypothetical protein L2E82_21405 [Cichorium intybus]
MSLHRTKGTFIGLLDAKRSTEWVDTEKLRDALKNKSNAKPKKFKFNFNFIFGDRCYISFNIATPKWDNIFGRDKTERNMLEKGSVNSYPNNSRHMRLTVLNFETVMLGKQSLDEFLSNITKGKIVIVSASPQSRASIAIHYGLSPLQELERCGGNLMRKMFCSTVRGLCLSARNSNALS